MRVIQVNEKKDFALYYYITYLFHICTGLQISRVGNFADKHNELYLNCSKKTKKVSSGTSFSSYDEKIEAHNCCASPFQSLRQDYLN